MRLVTLGEPWPAHDQPFFLDFVNTLHWDDGAPVELIGTDADLATWLAELGLSFPNLSGALPAVHRLRDHVRGVTVAMTRGAAPSAADLAPLSTALARPPGRLQLLDGSAASPQIVFATDASDAVLFSFQIALSLAAFLESGDRRRLKLCANPGCGFAFLDTSTNATRRWCFMRYCGNRSKVRAFRRRTTAQ